MLNSSIVHCGRDLDFQPRRTWPAVLPLVAWRGQLLCGFDRDSLSLEAVDLYLSSSASLLEAVKACYPELGLSELGRLDQRLQQCWPELSLEIREQLFRAYDLRWSDRLQTTLVKLLASPPEFQTWCDDKKIAPRDLSPLLALPEEGRAFSEFLKATAELGFSRSEGVRAIELGVELFLLGHPLNDILPSGNQPQAYLRQLEVWRRPLSAERDEQLKKDVERWPWPSQVQGQWQRVGDVSGLEIKIRTTSPEDLTKKLERLHSIGSAWSCKN